MRLVRTRTRPPGNFAAGRVPLFGVYEVPRWHYRDETHPLP